VGFFGLKTGCGCEGRSLVSCEEGGGAGEESESGFGSHHEAFSTLVENDVERVRF